MSDESSPSLSFDLIDAMRRRWPLLFLGCLCAGGLAALVWFIVPRSFESNVELLVMKKDPALTSVNSMTPSDGRSDVVEDVLATHIRLLGSRRVIRAAIEAQGLDELPGMQPHLTQTTPPRDKKLLAEEYISEHLAVGRGGEGQAANAQVLHATFRHTDTTETQAILAAVVDSYKMFLADTFADVGSQAFELFEQSRDRLSADVKSAEQAQAEFRQSVPIVFSQGNGPDFYESQLIELAEARNAFEQERAAITSRLRMVRDAIEGVNADKFTDSDRLALVDKSHVDRLNLLVTVERGRTDPSQTVTVTAPVNSTVRLVRVEGALHLAGVPNGGFDIDPWEINKALLIDEQTIVIDASGSSDVPVTLTDSHPEGALNYFFAVVEEPSGQTGLFSEVLIVELDVAPIVLDFNFNDPDRTTSVPSAARDNQQVRAIALQESNESTTRANLTVLPRRPAVEQRQNGSIRSRQEVRRPTAWGVAMARGDDDWWWSAEIFMYLDRNGA
jgi:hypothetical protein